MLLPVSLSKWVQNWVGVSMERGSFPGAHLQAHTSPAGPDSEGAFVASFPSGWLLLFPAGEPSNSCSFSFSFLVSPLCAANNSLPENSRCFFLDVTSSEACWYESTWGRGCLCLAPASGLDKSDRQMESL